MTMPAPDPSAEPQPLAPDALLAMLDEAGVPYELHRHRAIFTVAEGADLEASIPGLHCRNLFLRDKKGHMALVTAANDTQIDIKALGRHLGCDRFSFGSPERLFQYLGVRPGSVCPYAVVNDREGAVRMVLDAAMLRADRVVCHPLINTMSIAVAPDDLVRFLTAQGHAPEIVDFTVLQGEGRSC